MENVMDRVEICNIDRIPEDKKQYFYSQIENMINDYKEINNIENPLKVIVDEWPYLIVEDKTTGQQQLYIL
jgi:hypothetical protein